MRTRPVTVPVDPGAAENQTPSEAQPLVVKVSAAVEAAVWPLRAITLHHTETSSGKELELFS